MPNYILRIDGRADQKVTNDVWLWILKQLSLKQSSVTLTIDWKTIWYFNTKDITLVAVEERADNTELYAEQTKLFREKYEKKKAWIAAEITALSAEQKDFLMKLTEHCFPFVCDLTGQARIKAIRRYEHILMWFIRKCPHENYDTLYWKWYQFKPLSKYTPKEIDAQYWPEQSKDLQSMFNFAEEVTPQMDISILKR